MILCCSAADNYAYQTITVHTYLIQFARLMIPFVDHFLDQLLEWFLSHRSTIENFNFILP